ncbi:hypothetical protein PPL_11412 [Heterostelium album PN500]|uniref:Uncharacterized protein n=1 Tax=Heterostelium pallidum (strain ATCC 26659 / Pp 5 / PN500) TaxID=670386 RepID=D3BTB9_HETP5|nr:hypothetical protein PPL_11412 [Heterostelium album PN500]EFA75336.1 hypothetical protein PPL_11412 [Heterostelium album PN500]|eukprot:XP_020427470.1 hypothetical protein PPL_11412 [Heterostelium album PN500]
MATLDISNTFQTAVSLSAQQLLNKKFWSNRIGHTTVFERIYFTYIALSDVYTLISNKNNEHIKDLEYILPIEKAKAYVQSFLEATANPAEIQVQSVIDNFVNNKLTMKLGTLLNHEVYRSYLQEQVLYTQILQSLINLDIYIKEETHKADPEGTYLLINTKEENDPEGKGPTDEINSLLSIRRLHTHILSVLTVNYVKVPESIVKKVVEYSENEAISFGMKRYLARVVGGFSDRRENCKTILKSNGLPLLKYNSETDKLRKVIKGIGFSSYQNYINNLSEIDQSFVHREIRKVRLQSILTKVCGTATLFYFSKYMTENKLTATAITSYYFAIRYTFIGKDLPILNIIGKDLPILNTVHAAIKILLIPDWLTHSVFNHFNHRIWKYIWSNFF